MSTDDQQHTNGKKHDDRAFRAPGEIWREARKRPELMELLQLSLAAKRRGEQPVPATELMEYVRRARAEHQL